MHTMDWTVTVSVWFSSIINMDSSMIVEADGGVGNHLTDELIEQVWTTRCQVLGLSVLFP